MSDEKIDEEERAWLLRTVDEGAGYIRGQEAGQVWARVIFDIAEIWTT